jgi:hypothetical protein
MQCVWTRQCELTNSDKALNQTVLPPLRVDGRSRSSWDEADDAIMNTPETMFPVRVPWNEFPEVIVHSSIYKLKTLPKYDAAKRGNDQAAASIARAVVRPDKIDLAVDFIVPVIQVERGHYNAIPVALGAVLAKTIGARLWLDVCQINKVNHTDAGAQERLHNQPVFGGTAPPGKCLICDDVVTYGASLANLRGFLIAMGGSLEQQQSAQRMARQNWHRSLI